MAPAPLPPVLPIWARALIQLAPFIPLGLQNVLEYIGEAEANDGGNPTTWCQVQLIGQPIGSTERADDFVTTIDILNYTNGAPDNSWTQGDHDAVAGQMGTLTDSWATRMSNDYKWREQRHYIRTFNPYSLDEPFAKSGPPAAIYPLGGVGSNANYQAPQVAVTTTERTAYPLHWGRNYWPHPAGGIVSTGGYISSLAVDSWATAVAGIYETLAAAGFHVVVPTTQYTVGDQVVAMRGLLTVSELQMDNLFDVMRSRRPKKSTYKKVLPV